MLTPQDPNAEDPSKSLLRPAETSTSKERPVKPVNFLDYVDGKMQKGEAVDPHYLSDLSTRSLSINKPINFEWDDKREAEFKEKYGAKQLESARQLFSQSSDLFKDARMSYYTPQLYDSESLRDKGFKGFAKPAKANAESPEWEWDGNLIPKRKASMQQVAEKSSEYFALNDKGQYERKELKDGKTYDDVAGGWNVLSGKSLTISSNKDMIPFYPELGEAIKQGNLNPDAPFKDEKGLYRYREVKENEHVKMGIRSYLGPRQMYNNNWGMETLETLNDVAMKAMDAAVFAGYFTHKYAASGSNPLTSALERKKADRWFQDYQNWSGRRKANGSLEEDMGWDYSWSNKSKMIVDGLAQLAITSATGGAGSLLSAGAGRAAAYGFNTTYAMSAAREEGINAGLSTESADLMAVFAGGILAATEKLGGEQFIPKITGKGNVKEFTRQITGEVMEHAQKLGMDPGDLLNNKDLQQNLVASVLTKSNAWLSKKAGTRAGAAGKGFAGEGLQEISEDAGNMAVQEGFDLVSGNDNYKNDWEEALNNLRVSGLVGGITGGLAGGALFSKKGYEANNIEEDRLHYLTAAVLKGQEKELYKSLDEAIKLKVIDDVTAESYRQQIGYVKKISDQYKGMFPDRTALGEFIDGMGLPVDAKNLQDLGKEMQQFVQQEGITAQIRKDMVKQDILLSKAKQLNPGLFDGIKSVFGVPGQPYQVEMENGEVREINSSEKGLLAAAEGEWMSTDYKGFFDQVKLYSAGQRRLEELNYFEQKGLLSEQKLQEKEELIKEQKKVYGDIKKDQEKLGIIDDQLPMFEEYARMDWVQERIKDESISGDYMERATLETVKKQHPDWFEKKDFNVRSWKDMRLRLEYFSEMQTFDAQVQQDGIDSNKDALGQIVGGENGLAGLLDVMKEPMNVDGDTLKQINSFLDSVDGDGSIKGYVNSVEQTADRLNDIIRAANYLKTLTPEQVQGKIQVEGIPEFAAHGEQEVLSVEEKLQNIRPEEIAAAVEYLQQIGLFQPSEREIPGDTEESIRAEWDKEIGELTGLDDLMETEISPEDQENIDAAAEAINAKYEEKLANLQEPQKETFYPQAEEISALLGSAGEADQEKLSAFSQLQQARTLLPNLKEVKPEVKSDPVMFAEWVQNRNITFNDKLGESVIEATDELITEIDEDADFSDIERVNGLIREAKENILNLRLMTAMQESPLEQEISNAIYSRLSSALATLLKIREVAESNKNQRGKRDYQMKADYINLHVNFLNELNTVLGAGIDLSAIPSVFSGEVNTEVKEKVDASYALLLEAEKQMHEVIREKLSGDMTAMQLLDSMGLNKEVVYDPDTKVADGIFKQLHTSMDRPYGKQENGTDLLEMKAWYLASLERGNPQEFHDYLAEYMNDIKPEKVLLPSFEQVAILRQVFSNLNTDPENNTIARQLNDWGGKTKKVLGNSVFIRGIAGAGKSSFILRMAVQLYARMRRAEGLTTKVVYTAPIKEQVDNAGKALNFAEDGFGKEPMSFEDVVKKLQQPGALDDTDVLVVDEASVFGNETKPFLMAFFKYNKTRKTPLKLLLLGDELQKTAKTFGGRIALYHNLLPFFMERTVPLTTPYRTGKVDSGRIQNQHRKVLIELNKLYKADKHKGEYKGPWMEQPVKINGENIDQVAQEMMAFYDRPFPVRYTEEAGALSFGVKAFSNTDELYLSFARYANKWQSEKQVRFITEDRNKAIKGLRDAFRALGVPEPGNLNELIKTSAQVQGLNISAVFTDINAKAGFQKKGHVADITEAYQSQYVAESREVEVLAFVGDHTSEKVNSESQIAAYPPVSLDSTDESGTLTQSATDLQAENSRIAAHYKELGNVQESEYQQEEESTPDEEASNDEKTEEEVTFNENPMYGKKKSEMTPEELEEFKKIDAENMRMATEVDPQQLQKEYDEVMSGQITKEEILRKLVEGCKLN